jgi:hypothetical protein
MKIFRFIKALFYHVCGGFPKSSKKEILRRYGLCSVCEFYDEPNSECLHCGCNINTKKIFMNKLAWADQKCPIDKW